MSDTAPMARDDAGFTLIEVLVAFALLSLGLVAVYNAFGLHARSAAEVQFRERTMAEALTQLEAIVAEALPPTGEGTYSTGATWTSNATPIVIGEQGAVQSPDACARLHGGNARDVGYHRVGPCGAAAGGA